MNRLVQLNRVLGGLIEFDQDKPRRNFGMVAKDAAIGGVTSAVGTAGLLAGAGALLKRRTPELAGMLSTAAKQHIRVFNPAHTIPMMQSLPEASRLFGKQLRAVKGVEKLATQRGVPSFLGVHKAYLKSGINPQKDIKDIASFKKQYGRTPGDTMEKSVGLLSGMAATGVGVAGGAALSKGWKKNESENLSAFIGDLIELGIKRPTPGTAQSIDRYGNNMDMIRNINAVSRGKKPVMWASSDDPKLHGVTGKKALEILKRKNLVATHISSGPGSRPAKYAIHRPDNSKVANDLRRASSISGLPIERSRKLGTVLGYTKKEINQFIKRVYPHKLSQKLDELIQFKTLYIPKDKDEPPETVPKLEGVVDYTVQRHAAKRAGLHRDIRIGTKRHGLLSWATRKDLPSEGGKIAIHPQPVHAHSYLGWEGDIPEGQYGAGSVSTEKLGKALVTRSTPTEVHATLADQKEHHRLALVRTAKGWLMTRGKHPEPPPEAKKPSYKSVEPGKAHETLESLPEGSIVQPKIDGALVYVTTKGNRPEVFSHRKGKQSGRHIIHTERVFHGRPTTAIPREYQRTLIGELYGTRKGKAIEPQELGGILNTHLGESIAKQKKKGIDLKIMPFDYANGKGESYPERLAKVKATVQHLPQDKFHTPEEATSQEDVKQLFENIRKGRHPLTKEGVIIHPPEGKMIKIKNTREENVKIHSIFPGKGKHKHGGFYYADESGQPLGRVGTGFTDETRAELPKYIGRTARVRYQEKFKSGKLRAPSLIAIEENK